MKKPPARQAALALTAVIVAAAPAAAQDIARGERLAKAWCASCHQVGPNQGTSDVAPAFALIANDPDRPDSALRAWLIDPHPPMPDLNLAEDEIEDLIAYIGTLQAD